MIESLGSSLNFSAHGGWGKEKNLSAENSVRPKVLGAKPPPEAGRQSAGKKEGGWGEGPEGVALRPYGVKIFARPRFPIPIFFRRHRISLRF